MSKTLAAKIWATLERALIERCGLPNGRALEINRPYLIRWVGDRLTATAVDLTPLPAPPRSTPIAPVENPPRLARRGRKKAGLPPHENMIGDDAISRRLGDLLTRACTLRGYDGNDTVKH